jgi:hypothetical protein
LETGKHRVTTETADDMGARLLADIRDYGFREGEVQLSVETFIDRLVLVQESPWISFEKTGRQITQHAFANLLRPYGVASVRESAGPEKGKKFWRKADFADAWDRYLPPKGE